MEPSPNISPAARLATPIDQLPGINTRRARLIAKLGLRTVRDLLFFFPRDYLDLTDEREIADLEENRPVSVRGVVEEIELRGTGPGRSVLGVLIRQNDSYLRALWFNQPFRQKQFHQGDAVLLFGKARMNGGRWEMTHPQVEPLESLDQSRRAGLQPIYSLTEGLAQYPLSQAVRAALDGYLDELEEVFSEDLLERYDLLPLAEALPWIHFPESQEQLDAARHRLVFQELLILQLALSLRRRELHDLRQAPPLEATAKIDARIRRLLPFELTEGQHRVIQEVVADLALEQPMNRLLQGDVGSGKTAVAVYAMMVCMAHGYQAALMAPTEVLAQQHEQTIGRLLASSRVRCALLTGSQTPKERQEMLQKIESGEIDLIIGTQAIVLSGCRFSKLGLVVIDEQHKFGVRQRSALRGAGLDPHYLVMTATPIPRSVTMAFFGDLDVSVLRESPPGRQSVHTYLVPPDRESQWWEFVRKKISEGRQAYVVAPRIGEDQEGEPSADETETAKLTYQRLSRQEFQDAQVGLIHGRMSSKEKDQIMTAFRSGEIDVLVSTSVIEVGVDVPNATVMMILGAEWFGLAQLHQLRGRIRRGNHPGFCGIQADPRSPEAEARLETFISTDDGFRLAEVDFRLRGPGDLFGTRQHGMPPMRIADLLRDNDLHEVAREAAQQLIRSDPGLAEHSRLRQMVLVRYGKALELGDVG